MPRKSTKTTPASNSRSSSKRPAQDTPTRQSKRAKATARKSYAESSPEDDEEPTKNLSTESDKEDISEASNFDEASDVDPSSESEQEEAAAATSDEDDKPKKGTQRGRAVKKSLPLLGKRGDGEKEFWKSGAKLAPGTQVIIKKPKAREAGDTPFTDDTIHPNTMLFLKDLAANNDRQWLKLHDPDFRASFDDFSTFTEKVTEKVVEADETIPELPVKDVIYRIYRDVRFSKDPTPYKTYFSAAWSRTGRKGPYAHYYIQIQPNGGSFVGAGFWQPDAATLAKLRHDIDRKPHKIKQALQNPLVRKAFLNTSEDTEKGVVRAFVNLASNKSNALKRHPKGYDQNHKDIDLLRLRDFTLGKKLRDDEVVGTGGLGRIAELVACMVPFVSLRTPPSRSSPESHVVPGRLRRFTMDTLTAWKKGCPCLHVREGHAAPHFCCRSEYVLAVQQTKQNSPMGHGW